MALRLLPHPLLTFTLVACWILLMNSFSVPNLAIGLVIGIVVPLLTRHYWPGRPALRRPLVIADYVLVALWDIIVSNIQVAYLVLFRDANTLRSRFVAVPLDISAPEAIAILAATITLTPGTLSADFSSDRRALLVHCLDVSDVAEVVARIKSRYERRLMRIFE